MAGFQASNGPILSPYGTNLPSEAKSRYLKKITDIGIDPYVISPSVTKCSLECEGHELPSIEYPDVYHYLINTPQYSTESLKAYKSLDAYKYFSSGWVRKLLTTAAGNRFIFTSQVLHSQRLSDKPLEVWVAIQSDGVVLTAHCTCMAGLGEVCSHVAATLFSVEALVRMKKDVSCTSLPNSWLQPSTSSQRALTPKEVADMNFSAKRKMHQVNVRSVKRCPPVAKATDTEKRAFYEGLKSSGINSVILSALPDYNQDIKTYSSMGLPMPLAKIYDVKNTVLDFSDLVEKCEEIFSSLSISQSEAAALEQETRGQASSKTWFRHRAGRITASNMKAATRTNPDKPAISLIKRICYPDNYKFTTNATRFICFKFWIPSWIWGCEHEATARSVYEEHQKRYHQDFTITNSGLFVNPLYPHLGASPDGLISCRCCSEGVLEIKCPYCISDKDTLDTEDRKHFCLKENDSGVQELKRDHQYYFQIQTQMNVCEKTYCDFVVWGKSILHIERIHYDRDFWDECVQKSSKLYVKGVLPELYGKWFTLHPQLSCANPATIDLTKAICYCRRIESGTVIECKSGFCKFTKFHLHCLRLKNVPKTKWLCIDCKKVTKKDKSK